MFTTYEDLRNLLLEAARGNGATFRFGTRVEAVDEDQATLTLASGENFSASVIVGADGSKSVMRDMLFEGGERTQDTGLVVFKCAPLSLCVAVLLTYLQYDSTS